MNIFNKMTLASLKKNKTRTAVTIIGIMLSAVMITCVTSIVVSLQSFMLKTAVYDSGDWYGSALHADETAAEKLEADTRVTTTAIGEVLGYAPLTGCVNDAKPYLYVLGCNDTFFTTMPVRLSEGRLPGKPDEILLPAHLYTNGNVRYRIGDTASLTLGERIIDGELLFQNNPFLDGSSEYNGQKESFRAKKTRTYTVVGFYERADFEDFAAPGYVALTAISTTPEAGTLYDLYFKTEKPAAVYDMIESGMFGYAACDTNSNLLMFTGNSEHDTFTVMLYSLSGIIIALIMVGSVSLVYNAFSISVSERKKQFGLLSSVGATKKQTRKSVIFEALFVSAIGIPLGIGVGLLGIGLTLRWLGSDFTALYNGNLPFELGLVVDWRALAAAAVIALVTALISAYLPAKRASRVTAIEAIRQTSDVKLKAKTLKTPRLISKLFGLEGDIAWKQYKRNKSKYRTTVISLFLSIVLFISATSFCAYIKESVNGVFGSGNFDVSVELDDEQAARSDELGEKIATLKGVTKLTQIHEQSGILDPECTLYSDNMMQFLESNPSARIPLNIVSVSDSVFRDYLKENKMDEAEYFDAFHPKALASRSIRNINYDTERIEVYEIFSVENGTVTLYGYNHGVYETLSDDEKEEIAGQKIAANPLYVPHEVAFTVVDTLPFGADRLQGNVALVVLPESVCNAVLTEKGLERALWMFNSDTHEKDAAAVDEMINELGLDRNAVQVTDLAKEKETNRSLISIVTVFSYGFIGLISLIAVANVFNTISTNLNLRRREFAMLRSVGMTNKSMTKMTVFECLIYGIKSLLFGIPVSIGITYLIYISVLTGFDVQFFVPVYAICLAVLSVFLVVFSSMVYAVKKIKKQNVVDELKNENV